MKAFVIASAALSTAAHGAVLLGHDLTQPVSNISDVQRVAPGTADLEPSNRPAWAAGVISLTLLDGHVTQAFIEAPQPVTLPDNGPLEDALVTHAGNKWVYADGTTATYVPRLPSSQIGVIAIEHIPASLPKPGPRPIQWQWFIGLFAALAVGGFVRRSLSK